MKISLHICLLLAIILMVNINSSFSQSLQIMSCDTLVTGNTTSTFQSNSICKNISSTNQTVRIKIHVISLQAGSNFNMCDLNNCYGNTAQDFTSPNPFTLTPGQTTGNFVHVELFPNGMNGTSVLAFRYYLDNNVSDYVEYTATFVVGTAGVSENNNSSSQSINLYPNPANDFVNVSIPSYANQNPDNAEIYNSLGLLEKNITINSLSNNLTFNTSDLANGTYLLVLNSNGNKILTKPFIIYR